MQKKLISAIIALILCVFSVTGCSNAVTKSTTVPATGSTTAATTSATTTSSEKESVVILYTNDVHTHIDNFLSEGDDNSKLSYASVAAYKKELANQGKNVLLVDAGDFLQGTAYSTLDNGESIINIMNTCGYDLVTPGNHEFDLGMPKLFELVKKSDFPFISCNFKSLETNSSVFEPSKVFDFNGTKVAFVGVSTPESLVTSSPKNFTNDKGEYIYDFSFDKTGEKLAEAFQKAVDEAGKNADYVIGLGHLGEYESSSPYTSKEIISKTHGICAFIDGHSHTVNESTIVKNSEGKDVVLTQTGTALGSFGELTLTPGKPVETKLITAYDRTDSVVRSLEQKCIDMINISLGQILAYTEVPFYITNPENKNERIIRSRETNLGDFVADAFYWYYNEKEDVQADCAIVNSGSIRSDVAVGDVDKRLVKSIFPFENFGSVVEISGQQLLDALEYGVNSVGKTEATTGYAIEFGGFLQVAGIKFDVDFKTESTVSRDENGFWTAGPTGDYKVSNLQIYDKDSCKYIDVDLKKIYKVAGVSYLLSTMGDGFAMFEGSKLIAGNSLLGFDILTEYVKAFEMKNDIPTISNKTSPLSKYDGYQLDYSNFAGAGRINIQG